MFEALIDIIDTTTQNVVDYYNDTVHHIEESEVAKAYRKAKEQAYKNSKEYEIKNEIIKIKKAISDSTKSIETMNDIAEEYHINSELEETYDDLDLKLPISPRYGEFERAVEGKEIDGSKMENVKQRIEQVRVDATKILIANNFLLENSKRELKSEVTNGAVATAALHAVAIVGTVALAPVVGTTVTVIGVAACLPFAYHDFNTFKNKFKDLRDTYNI